MNAVRNTPQELTHHSRLLLNNHGVRRARRGRDALKERPQPYIVADMAELVVDGLPSVSQPNTTHLISIGKGKDYLQRPRPGHKLLDKRLGPGPDGHGDQRRDKRARVGAAVWGAEEVQAVDALGDVGVDGVLSREEVGLGS